MKFQKIVEWIAGKEDLAEINRIFNVACFIATLFCIMAAVESAFANLSPILVADDFFYSFILGLLYYLSRFKKKFGISRFLSIFVLLFIYTPILWIYNGGSASGIPYYIPMFSSFLTVMIVGKKDSKNHQTLNGIILIIFFIIMTGLILFEWIKPDLFYHYQSEPVRYFDIILSLLFAMTGNYFILRSFIELYYKQLDKVKEYSRRLEELVIRDSMTNLYNHAFVIARLSEEIEKAARYKRPLSILMLDLDLFKQVNDQYGHSFGDEVLIKVAELIQSNCRSVDIAARYGGEEFLILLPETDVKAASIVANRFQKILQSIQLSTPVNVTASGGITEFFPGDTPSTMIDRVDALLYEAKNEGRNRIKSSSEGLILSSNSPLSGNRISSL
jgi:diguanylate cyclase (GGDEF)-like protein